MYIVRWLMGHPIIAAWVLAAIAILLNFGQTDKISDDTKTHKSSTTQDDSAQLEQLQPKIVDGTSIKNSLEVGQSEGENIAPKTTNNVNLTDVVVSGNSIVPTNIETSEVPKAKSDPSVTEVSDLGRLSTEEMLIMAREAYWNNGLDEAAQIYKQLIKLEPKTIEHRGELGNVYWRQGFPKKAAELYSEISLPMIEQGDSKRVANMIGFIGLFYPDRASKIHKRLQSEEPVNN